MSAALAAVALVASMPCSAEIVPLHSIPLTVTGAVGDGMPAVVKIRVDQPAKVVRQSAAPVDDEGWLVLDLRAGGTVDDPPEEHHRMPSFLIDFDEAPIQELLAEWPDATDGSDPVATIAELVAATDRAIPNKTLARSWDAASVVVRRGEGDCTEHAFLLAALARARGLPARVMTGALLTVTTVDDEKLVQAWGHAWTEIFDGDAWQLVDASNIAPTQSPADAATEFETLRLYYLPLSLVENEGPGYGVHLFSSVAKTHPHEVAVEWRQEHP